LIKSPADGPLADAARTRIFPFSHLRYPVDAKHLNRSTM
jgi:hypothetical protein